MLEKIDAYFQRVFEKPRSCRCVKKVGIYKIYVYKAWAGNGLGNPKMYYIVNEMTGTTRIPIGTANDGTLRTIVTYLEKMIIPEGFILKEQILDGRIDKKIPVEISTILDEIGHYILNECVTTALGQFVIIKQLQNAGLTLDQAEYIFKEALND